MIQYSVQQLEFDLSGKISSTNGVNSNNTKFVGVKKNIMLLISYSM